MHLRFVTVTLVLMWTAPALARGQVPAELRAAMQARLEAVWKKDTAAWGRLTADEFTVVVPEGMLTTKTQRLAALLTETPQPIHPVRDEVIHVYGDAVVRRFVDDDEWVLEVWVKQNAKWRVVAAQVNYVNKYLQGRRPDTRLERQPLGR